MPPGSTHRGVVGSGASCREGRRLHCRILQGTARRSPGVALHSAHQCRGADPVPARPFRCSPQAAGDVINKTGRFLDPIIAVVAPDIGFWTPNGRHRLAAMRRLGARSIAALVVADREVAWQILALNTEKAHNLKERSLEVIRIYRGLVEEDASRPES